MSPTIIVSGFIVGFLIGVSGMGGGVLMTPFLIVGMGIPASLAIGTDLTYAALTKAVGAWQHSKHGTVDWKLVKWLAIGSIPASLIGVALIAFLRSHLGDQVDILLNKALAIVLLIVAFVLIKKSLPGFTLPEQDFKVKNTTKQRTMSVLIGALGGTAVGLTSIGSGSIMMALMASYYRLKAVQLVGTDICHAVLLTGSAALAHGVIGNVDLQLVLELLIGSIPGVILGSRLSMKMPDRILRASLGALLLGSAVKLLI